MTTIKRPYFLNNKKWYYFDDKEWKYKLTSLAPKEAIESYSIFYKSIIKDYKIENNFIYLFNKRNIKPELCSYIYRLLQSSKEKKIMVKYLNNYKGYDESYIFNAAKRIHNMYLEDNL